MTAQAKIIADSISEAGIRITTMELEYDRFIHSQFLTHRQFSRNAQSSRAIPTAKQIELIKKTPNPVFRKLQKGMQAGEVLDAETQFICSDVWNAAKQSAIYKANDLLALDVAKEITNRLLEPFSTIKVVVTATEWENFFDLRLHHAAQPEMQELAQAMKTAMDESTPNLLRVGEWHLPYVPSLYHSNCTKDDIAKISAARCARVSYLNHDNSTPDIEKDLELANRLLSDKHLSPFEHQAKPMKNTMYGYSQHLFTEDGVTHCDKNRCYWSANFRGWIQHRALIA